MVYFKCLLYGGRSSLSGRNVCPCRCQHCAPVPTFSITWWPDCTTHQDIKVCTTQFCGLRSLEQSITGYLPVDNTETISKTTEDVSSLLGLRNMTVCALSCDCLGGSIKMSERSLRHTAVVSPASDLCLIQQQLMHLLVIKRLIMYNSLKGFDDFRVFRCPAISPQNNASSLPVLCKLWHSEF